MRSASKGSDARYLLTRSEAAKALNVPGSVINRLRKIGVLTPVSLSPILYSYSNVSDALEIVKNGNSIGKISSRAYHAHIGVKRLEKKLDALAELLGLGASSLSIDPWDMRFLNQQMLETTKGDTSSLPVSEVMDWAKALLSMDEHYLAILADVLSTQEPWRAAFWLAEVLLRAAPKERFPSEAELRAAYGYLSFAQRHVRQVAYFYCRNLEGKAGAAKRFHDLSRNESSTKGVAELVLAKIAEDRRKLGKNQSLS